MFEFLNGVEVKDKITGFKGVIVGRSDYISGCVQYAVKPQTLDKDGKTKNSIWFDANRIEVIGIGIKLDKPDKAPGGPSTEGHGRSI